MSVPWRRVTGRDSGGTGRRRRLAPAIAILAVTAISTAVAGLGWELGRLDQVALEQQRATSLEELARVQAGLSTAAALGVDESDLAPIKGRVATLERAAHSEANRQALAQTTMTATALASELDAFQRAQRAENAAVQQAASVILAHYAGQLDAMRAVGRAALADGRNDASLAAFLKIDPGRSAGALERYGALLSSVDPNEAALGVAGAQRYSPLVHNALIAQLPSKVIVVSLAAQRLQAFQNGHLVADTLVTTGRPTLPTDVGPMQVVRKSSPWTMRSPWPKGSPYWYPDTKVQTVLWFTNTGEGIHDAAWEPSSAYGPGSPAGPFASHGCIHTPVSVMAFLYQWALLGTPVVVYPGDGSPASAQLAQRSVNAKGEPLGSQPSGV